MDEESIIAAEEAKVVVSCRVCAEQADGHWSQIFSYTFSTEHFLNPGPYFFDVNKAWEFARQPGREIYTAPSDDIARIIASIEITPEHAAHVSLSEPGIKGVVRLWLKARPAKSILAPLFIDGNHRASRLMALSRPFFFYALTESETLQTMQGAYWKARLARLCGEAG